MATATAKAVQVPQFELPPLPYPEDALEPVISAETLESEFRPEFTRGDLINLRRGQAYVRLACEGQTSRPFSMQTYP